MLVAVVIAFPQTVTALLDRAPPVDLDKVEIPMPETEGATDDARRIDELAPAAEVAASAPTR